MLAGLIGAIASGEAKKVVQRTKRMAIAYAIAGLLGLVGVVFLLVAGYLAAAHRFGAIEAALGFGGGFVLAALLIVFGFSLATRQEKKKAAARRKTDMSTLAAASALAILPALANRKALLPTLATSALGIIGWRIYEENTRGRRRGSRPPDDDDAEDSQHDGRA